MTTAIKLLRSKTSMISRHCQIKKKTNEIFILPLLQASNRIFLVLEFCAGGDLGAFIQKHGKVSDTVAKHFMRQLGMR